MMKVESSVYKRSRPGAAAARSRGVGQNVGPPTHPGGVIIGGNPPPELATLTPQPPQQHQQQQHQQQQHPHIALPTQPYQLHHQGHHQQHQQQQQHMILGTQQQKLIRRGHQMEMLEQAKLLCDRQDFVDVTIYCEDGVVRAHQMLLAVASPFLKLLFQSSPLYGIEDICIILPETKACLVQALIHFVYTGTVVSKEDHFYSLMKLVYALSINASIEAESTNARPTAFSAPLVPLHTVERVRRLPHQLIQPNLPTVPSHQQHMTHMSLQQHQQQQSVNAAAAAAVAAITTPALAPPCVIPQAKMGRYTTGPAANSLPVPQHNLTNHQNKMPIQLPTQPVPLVNGVTIKNEPQHVASGSYIAIDPNTGLHYKVEVPNGQLTGDLGSDPLAAIMHETIFTETSAGGQTTMYTTENGHVIYTTQPTTTVSVPTLMGSNTVTQQHQMDPNDLSGANMSAGNGSQGTAAGGKRGKKRKQNNKENAIMAESVDDLPCAPDDEDLNTPYACAHCNKTIKGRVMLQAHQYQEHYDNPELSRVDIGDKHACRVCLKLFTRNSDVKAHILRVHCGDRRYPCTMCGKRFKESTHLRKHLYTHTGERPHYCTLCDKGFQTSSDLKRHKRTRVHQERVEQLKTGNDGTPNDASNADTSNAEFNRWVDDDDDEDDVSGNHKQVHHMKGGVNSTAQQLLTSITQPVSMVSANGQQMESTIDMKALGGSQAGGSNSNSSSLPSAPLAVPVSSSWSTDANSSTTHYDLKDLSAAGANDVDMNALIQHHNDVTPVTTTSASMPSIVDMHHHHDIHQRQLLQQQQHIGQQHIGQQQMFLHEQQYQEMPTSSQDLSSHKKVDMKGTMDSPPGGQDEEERLTVVEDEESSSNPVA